MMGEEERKIHSRSSSYSCLQGLDVELDEEMRHGGAVYGYEARNLDTPLVIVSSEVSLWSRGRKCMKVCLCARARARAHACVRLRCLLDVDIISPR